jgi:hypothetical protein
MATVDEKIQKAVEYLEGIQAVYELMDGMYRGIGEEVTANVYVLAASDLDLAIAILKED